MNAIEVLELKIAEKRDRLERMRALMTSMARLQQDIMALERSLAILKGEDQPPSVPFRVELRREMPSLPVLVAAVLREAGKPLTADQLVPLVAARGRNSTKETVVGTIYRCIKKGKLFCLIKPGTFGLLEWNKKE